MCTTAAFSRYFLFQNTWLGCSRAYAVPVVASTMVRHCIAYPFCCITMYNLCAVFFLAHSVYLSTTKDQHVHWVCWMSTSRKNGFNVHLCCSAPTELYTDNCINKNVTKEILWVRGSVQISHTRGLVKHTFIALRAFSLLRHRIAIAHKPEHIRVLLWHNAKQEWRWHSQFLISGPAAAASEFAVSDVAVEDDDEISHNLFLLYAGTQPRNVCRVVNFGMNTTPTNRLIELECPQSDKNYVTIIPVPGTFYSCFLLNEPEKTKKSTSLVLKLIPGTCYVRT